MPYEESIKAEISYEEKFMDYGDSSTHGFAGSAHKRRLDFSAMIRKNLQTGMKCSIMKA